MKNFFQKLFLIKIKKIYLSYLKYMNVFIIKGRNSVNFLEGQITNNIKNISQNKFGITSYCKNNGCLFSNIIFKKINSKILICIIHNSTLNTLIKKLIFFTMIYKISFEFPDSNIFGIFTVKKVYIDFMNNIKLYYPVDDFCISNNIIGNCIYNNKYKYINWLLIFNNSKIIYLCKILKITIFKYVENYWELNKISYFLNFKNKYLLNNIIPQKINLDMLNYLDFFKGCYTGQEIITRIKNLGSIKNRLFICLIKYNDAKKKYKNLNKINLFSYIQSNCYFNNLNYNYFYLGILIIFFESKIFLVKESSTDLDYYILNLISLNYESY